MKSKRSFIAISLVLLTPFLFSLTGEVEYLEGDVLIARNGEEEYADFGSPVEEDDVVTTESDSLAILRLSDGTALKIRENTTIRLVRLTESAEIYLDKGSFFFQRYKTADRKVYGKNSFCGCRSPGNRVFHRLRKDY